MINKDYLLAAATGVLVSTLVTVPIMHRVLDTSRSGYKTAPKTPVPIAREYTDSPTPLPRRQHIKYTNKELGEVLRHPALLDSADTSISREWKNFSFEGWTYVPFDSFERSEE